MGLTKNRLTDVVYIGHASVGDPDETPEQRIEKLKIALKFNTLDPMFEDSGNFIIEHPVRNNGLPCVTFFGNFFDLSLVFRIDTNDNELIKDLTRLIKENQTTKAYKTAKSERKVNDENYKNQLTGF